jgi:hypothetical protein
MVIHQIPPASMSSASNQRIFTPPSTITTSTVGLVSTTPSGLEGRSEADQVSPNLSRTTSGAPQFTPSSTTSDIYQVQDDPDPDIPLPSVERDVLFTTNRPITPSTVYYTPSLSSNSHSTEQAEGDDSDILEIGNIRDLRLTSPDTRSIPCAFHSCHAISSTQQAEPISPQQRR